MSGKRYNAIRRILLITLILIPAIGSGEICALDPNLRIDVNPGNIAFNITNPDPLPSYYSSTQQILLRTRHTLRKNQRQWFVGIRATSAYLVDNMNPVNRIPVTRLRWSRDGVNFHELTERWVFVNTYIDQSFRPRIERISYRLYPDRIYSAGQYTVQIKFDARWTNFPWN